MSADISRKQKKKDKKNKIIEDIKIKSMSEIEKEAVYHSEKTVEDDSVRANNIPEHKLVDEEVINKIAQTETEETNHVEDKHLDFFSKHPEIKKHEITLLWCLVGILLVIIAISVSLHFTKSEIIDSDNKMITALNLQLDSEKINEAELQTQIDELNNKVTALSDSLAAKNDELNNATEEVRTLHVPTSYPLKGTGTILSTEESNAVNDNDDNDEDEEYDEMSDEGKEVAEGIEREYKSYPYTMFMTSNDTKVIATGLGKVVAISQDSNFGYAIKIDHENGYYSIYRGYGVPLVTEGDYVSRGCVLMSIGADSKYFLYQIIFEGNYVDPMSILEING